MKPAVIIMALMAIFTTQAQVGIGTTNPQATLDINGTVKINTTNQPAVTASKIGGLDADGNFREVVVGESLKISNNEILATGTFKHSFGQITLEKLANGNSDTFHNVDLKLDIVDDPLTPEIEGNYGKSIIRIYGIDSAVSNNPQNVKITGFKAGVNGQHIWIYAQSANVDLKPNDSNSTATNQIETNSLLRVVVWEMLELVYDATHGKWIIMQHAG